MEQEIYQIKKNENIDEVFNWFIISSFSPLIDKMEDVKHIENLIIICNDQHVDIPKSYSNVSNIFFIEVDYSIPCIDYGIVRNHISKFEFKSDHKICIDTTNLVIQIYSYIYTYLIDLRKCKDVWFIYHEIKAYNNPKEYKYHDGTLKIVQLECFEVKERKMQELIVFLVGFEGILTNLIEREKEPSKKIIINGFPSYLLSYKDVSLMNNSHLFSNKYTIDYCTASNPFQTYNKLLSIYDKYNTEYKITIAPCGSTPSSIGTVMFASTKSDVNIVIARPESYNFCKREYINRWIYCLKNDY